MINGMKAFHTIVCLVTLFLFSAACRKEATVKTVDVEFNHAYKVQRYVMISRSPSRWDYVTEINLQGQPGYITFLSKSQVKEEWGSENSAREYTVRKADPDTIDAGVTAAVYLNVSDPVFSCYGCPIVLNPSSNYLFYRKNGELYTLRFDQFGGNTYRLVY